MIKNIEMLFRDFLKKKKSAIYSTKFIEFLVRDCLFRRDKITEGLHFPLCKNEISRD